MQDEGKQSFRVVAALIRQEGKVLLTQRWPGKHLGLTWEFPGGKVEIGENDNQALKRELLEELGIDVEIGTCCFETRHGYGSKEVHLLIYRCSILNGTPTAIDVKAIEWVGENELSTKSFPPADLLFVQELSLGRIGTEEVVVNAGTNIENEDEENDIVIKPAQVISRPPRK
ncbi:(deoxy)nucleoside triphosphate pyrophosphohydrolase [Sulfobacillus acidophilus]|uniref:8-oxo-dGTP diphosphatase n=1 Tax=Sulfobacillus acidophilus TaxID=53633 RepID=A0ABS3AWT5_9FIRM|nr:(deoxy)nucleoside triphosphate pyrophosphohydrolase [Sulfobacillus acidophilus]